MLCTEPSGYVAYYSKFPSFYAPPPPRIPEERYIIHWERKSERERENAGNGEFIIGCTKMEHSKSLCGFTKAMGMPSRVHPVLMAFWTSSATLGKG